METRSAIVTGGAQGIGRAISAALAEAGLRVVLLDVDEAAGGEAQQAMPGSVFVAGDASDEAAVRRAVEAAQALGALKAAVANAGIGISKPVTELSLAEWNRVLSVNLTGGFLLAKHAAPFLKQHRGAMVLIASTRAHMSEGDTEAYTATKGGVVALTHALAISLGPEVRVNCVSPGWVPTDAWQRADRRREPSLSDKDHAQHPAGRAGRPEDIARLVRYLVSEDAGFITGQEFIADGGMTRKMVYV